MYLRLMWDQVPVDSIDERRTIETVFEKSSFKLISEIHENPRGGFGLHVECTADDSDEIVELLQKNNLIAVI